MRQLLPVLAIRPSHRLRGALGAMTELPSMPLYVDDYEADTAHLTPEEDGIYNRLLRLCWRSPECMVPDDETWLRRKLRVDQACWERACLPVIEEFFTCKNGFISHRKKAFGGSVGWQRHPSNWPDGSWNTVRKAVLDRDRHRCRYCGAKCVPLEVDHVIPRSMGGDNSFTNLVAACARCNRSKGARTPTDWLRGGSFQ